MRRHILWWLSHKRSRHTPSWFTWPCFMIICWLSIILSEYSASIILLMSSSRPADMVYDVNILLLVSTIAAEQCVWVSLLQYWSVLWFHIPQQWSSCYPFSHLVLKVPHHSSHPVSILSLINYARSFTRELNMLDQANFLFVFLVLRIVLDVSLDTYFGNLHFNSVSVLEPVHRFCTTSYTISFTSKA